MTTLILPGLGGSGPGHWQRHWLDDHPDAYLVEQDDWDRPHLDAWVHHVVATASFAPGALIVAHSLAGALVAHLALRHPRLDIAGALIVAPADVDDCASTSVPIAGFGPMPLVRLPFPSIVVASRDDPFARFERSQTFADAWGARLVDLGDSGHINVASGFGRWPEGYRLAAELAGRRTARPLPLPPLRHGRPALAGRLPA